MKINLYSEMNNKISGLLRLSEQPAQMYAAALIDAYRATGLEPDEIPQLQEKYDTAIKVLSGAILEKVETPHWVPCNERFPEESGTFIICTSHGDVFAAEYWQEREEFSRRDGTKFYSPVVYWQPLPQPPKGELE